MWKSPKMTENGIFRSNFTPPKQSVRQQKVIFAITTGATGLLSPEMETLADLGDSIYIYLLFVSQNLKSYMWFSNLTGRPPPRGLKTWKYRKTAVTFKVLPYQLKLHAWAINQIGQSFHFRSQKARSGRSYRENDFLLPENVTVAQWRRDAKNRKSHITF